MMLSNAPQLLLRDRSLPDSSPQRSNQCWAALLASHASHVWQLSGLLGSTILTEVDLEG